MQGLHTDVPAMLSASVLTGGCHCSAAAKVQGFVVRCS